MSTRQGDLKPPIRRGGVTCPDCLAKIFYVEETSLAYFDDAVRTDFAEGRPVTLPDGSPLLAVRINETFGCPTPGCGHEFFAGNASTN